MPAVLNHCDVRGSEAYCGEDSHIVLHEQGGAAQIGGVTVCPLPNNPDGTFDLQKLESKMKSDRQHETISKLVAVENTINGRVVPQQWIDRLAEVAKKHNLRMHMDGARLWNASVASGLPAREIVGKFDSVTFCLSKGLGAPAGSVLCGTRAFVEKARRTRKVLGGGMRQVGILAAAGIVALDEIVPLLKEDHRRAYSLATAINDMGSKIFSVDLGTTHTNMVLVSVRSASVGAKDFIARLVEVRDDVEDDRILVRGLALTNELARFVMYYQVIDELATAAIRKIKHVIREFESRV